MAVGDYYTIVASTNAVDWVAKSSEAESPYVDVAYLKRKFIVVLREGGRTFIYQGGVQRSILNDAFLAEITYGNGFYLAVGESDVPEPASATVVVSTNLLSWDFFQPEFLSKGALYDVEYGNMIFVTRGDAGVFSSADGMRWTRSLQNLNALNSITGLTYGGGIFLLTGCVGKLATSTDGQHWTVRDTGVTNGLGRGVFANHTFLLPSSAFFLQSDPVTTLQLAASSQPELSIDGPPDWVCDIEIRNGLESTNTWQVADTVTLTNPPTVWRDSNSAPHPQRFYRAILRP